MYARFLSSCGGMMIGPKTARCNTTHGICTSFYTNALQLSGADEADERSVAKVERQGSVKSVQRKLCSAVVRSSRDRSTNFLHRDARTACLPCTCIVRRSPDLFSSHSSHSASASTAIKIWKKIQKKKTPIAAELAKGKKKKKQRKKGNHMHASLELRRACARQCVVAVRHRAKHSVLWPTRAKIIFVGSRARARASSGRSGQQSRAACGRRPRPWPAPELAAQYFTVNLSAIPQPQRQVTGNIRSN